MDSHRGNRLSGRLGQSVNDYTEPPQDQCLRNFRIQIGKTSKQEEQWNMNVVHTVTQPPQFDLSVDSLFGPTEDAPAEVGRRRLAQDYGAVSRLNTAAFRTHAVFGGH